jgi:decaprenylphospho-beta-D-erythro-pentofuranosid-2-ulose 2-reductase
MPRAMSSAVAHKGPPLAIAAVIGAAIDRGRDVVYLPWFWRPIMLVIRLIPERLFKRLRL